MGEQEKARRARILLVGLDSADLALLEPWMEAGELPNLARFAHEGAYGPLRSTTPPISPVAWASFVTGKNPGKHGIFDFREPGKQGRRFISTASRKGRSLWRILSERGRDVGVINLPFSYPPEPVRGFFVSGYGAPSTASTYTYPAELREEIDRVCPGYRIHVHPIKYDYWRRFDRYVRKLRDLVERRTCAALHLLRSRPWDVAMVTYFATDSVQHIAWHLADPTHPRYDPEAIARHGNPVLELYRQVDAAVGDLMDAALRQGDPTLLLILSDHGGTAVRGYISLNTWLERQGLLRYRQKSLPAMWGRLLSLVGLSGHRGLMVRGKRICAAWEQRAPVLSGWLDLLPGWAFANGPARIIEEIDCQRTKAYAYGDYGQIHLNVKGETSYSTVNRGQDYESLVRQIREGLTDLVDQATGEKVVEECIRPAELYAGPYRNRAADLLAIGRRGYLFESLHDRRSEVVGRQSAPTRRYTGMHRSEGLFIAWGPMVAPARIRGARLIDVAPTVLYAADCPVPADVDGQVLEDLFVPAFRAERAVRYGAAVQDAVREGFAGDVYSEREAAALEERLRRMGYLG
jgi:predicted AlkP superfamily phosphohydrolase/phosphomutase